MQEVTPRREKDKERQPPKGERKSIRVLIVDDRPIVRQGVKACIASRGRVEIVGEASEANEALDRAKELEPHILLMSSRVLANGGRDVAKRLHRELPGAEILVLCAHDGEDCVLKAVRSGARGYVRHDVPPSELLRAIHLVHRGETLFERGAAPAAPTEAAERKDGPPRVPELSRREVEVLGLIAEGLSSKEMAESLGVSPRTIETHRERIKRKLKIRTVAGLTKFAISKGIATVE
jgi:DNA-binding NarL/FixJ family response regulator